MANKGVAEEEVVAGAARLALGLGAEASVIAPLRRKGEGEPELTWSSRSKMRSTTLRSFGVSNLLATAPMLASVKASEDSG